MISFRLLMGLCLMDYMRIFKYIHHTPANARSASDCFLVFVIPQGDCTYDLPNALILSVPSYFFYPSNHLRILKTISKEMGFRHRIIHDQKKMQVKQRNYLKFRDVFLIKRLNCALLFYNMLTINLTLFWLKNISIY